MKNIAAPRAGTLACLSLAILLSGCSAPQRPTPSLHIANSAPLAGLPGNRPGWPKAAWWQQFADPQLNQLMQQAMAGSTTLTVAQARYQQATLAVRRQQAQTQPQLKGTANLGAGYSDYQFGAIKHHSGTLAGSTLLNFSWDLDLWGKKTAAIAQAVDSAHAQQASKAVARSALQYQLATLYFQWQAAAARQQVLTGSLNTAKEYLRVVNARIDAGVEDDNSRDKATAQLAQLRQQQAMLAGQLRIVHAQIAALIGISDGQLPAFKMVALPTPQGALPANAKLGLMARRPDIVAARWQISAASQGIKQAQAAYYPDISLSGLAAFLKMFPALGSQSTDRAALANIGPSVSLPLFEGDRLDAAFAASTAKLNTAIAHYNQTVVQAAGQVANAVLTLQQLTQAATAQQSQYQAAQRQYQRAQLRVQQGVDDPRQALAARLQLNQQRDNRLQLQAQRLNAQLQLIQQLGGGYQAPQQSSRPSALKDAP